MNTQYIIEALTVTVFSIVSGIALYGAILFMISILSALIEKIMEKRGG